MTIVGDRVAVTVRVDVAPAVAFEVFTTEIDLWWRKGIAYRVAGKRPGVLALEPELGGRLFEEYQGPSGPAVHVAGTITAWDPPARLAFEWRGSNFAPGESTHVEVTFTATESGATMVELVHTGFATLPPDHPVRHGESVEVFLGHMGRWWGDLMTTLREYLADRE
jgi:uncharacterized protein YndB with AHSA1/START domain